MATIIPSSPPASALRRRILWLGLALIGIVLAWFWRPLNAYAQAGAAFGARVACSCRYEGGRPLGDCHKDLEPGMELISLSEDAASKSVTASFPILARQTATYRPDLGCQLQPWQG